MLYTHGEENDGMGLGLKSERSDAIMDLRAGSRNSKFNNLLNEFCYVSTPFTF
jgi:hypothetical protein